MKSLIKGLLLLILSFTLAGCMSKIGFSEGEAKEEIDETVVQYETIVLFEAATNFCKAEDVCDDKTELDYDDISEYIEGGSFHLYITSTIYLEDGVPVLSRITATEEMICEYNGVETLWLD